MALDDVVSSLVTGERIEEATHRTIRWIDRCIAGAALCMTERQEAYRATHGDS